ncbi:MAG: hypothetical protein JNK05_31150 [Myxococcales bacterium]|nr:hypothetical protein [Myxococcales bacterium]
MSRVTVAGGCLVALASCATPRASASSASASPAPAAFAYEVPLSLDTRSSIVSVWVLRPDRPATEAQKQMNLVFGEGISREVELLLRPTPARGCPIEASDLRLEGVESSAADVIQPRLDGRSVRVRMLRVGASELTVRAMYSPRLGDCVGEAALGASVATALRIQVNVLPLPTRTTQRVVGCAPSAAMMGVAGRVPYETTFVDLDGSELHFSNVRVAGGFRLRSNVALPGWSFDAARGLTLPRRRATLSLVPLHGEPGINLAWALPSSEIERLDVEFFVAGAAGSPVTVTDGASIAGSHRKLRGIYARVLAAQVCDAFDMSSLELESDTPEVCRLYRNARGHGDSTNSDAVYPHAIRLVRDGECSVRLRGAALDHGRGIERRVRATFSNVTNFIDFPAEAPAP